MVPIRSAPAATTSNSCPGLTRSTRNRCAAFWSRRYARSPSTRSAIQRRRVMVFRSYAGKHKVRSGGQPKIQNAQQTALEDESVERGELRLKKTFRAADERKNGADGHPGLASPGNQVNGAEDDADRQKDQAFGPFAAHRPLLQPGRLQFGEAPRQEQANRPSE